MFALASYKGTRPGFQGLFNRIVRARTRGIYSHTEVLFSDGVSASSSFLDGGIRFKRIEYKDDKWDLQPLPAHLEASARAFFEARVGKAYDYWSNFQIAFGFAPNSTDKWMCSEAAMDSLGLNEAWRFDPNEATVIAKRLWELRK
jgi:hypothetical protein